jgi:hypothetical protein
LETERSIEETQAAPSNPGIDWVRRMLEEAVARKQRHVGFFGGQVH